MQVSGTSVTGSDDDPIRHETHDIIRPTRSLMLFLTIAHVFVTPRGHPVSMSETMTGRKFTGKRRAPKAIDERRVCVAGDCETVLSRYNRRVMCHVHAPVKFPRVRGRQASTRR